MSHSDAYIALQRHLDRQAIGFPATKSKAEIKILKHIFTPIEARIAACLSYKPQPLPTIYKKANHLVESSQKLEEDLSQIAKKGGIEITNTDGEKRYRNVPFVVGMYEFQVNALTPEFIDSFQRYTSDLKFGMALLSSKLPQMRTIPIAKSIQPHHHIATFDEVAELIQHAKAPFVILECICRKKNSLVGTPCRVTTRMETCLAVGEAAQSALTINTGREIQRGEAISILEQNQKDGLVLQPSNTEIAEFICSCCGCCCGMLNMQKRLPVPVDFWSSNYFTVIDTQACNGCGICEKRCQVDAIKVTAEKQCASVDLKRCIGCGLCIPTCPQHALALKKKESEVKPPKTRDELYDTIMAHKKSGLEKYKVAAKLIVDAIRTGQTNLLKGAGQK